MKVLNKFFVIALLLSFILAAGVVSAADDMTFEQSNTNKITTNDPDINPDYNYDKLTTKETKNENNVDKLSTSGGNQLLKNDHHDNFTNIQNKINSANPGDTIFLDGKTYIGLGTELTITKQLTIVGGSNLTDTKYATLDAKGLSRILTVSASNITLKGIKFINGNSASAGALYVTGNDFNISNSIFSNNYADINYGAMFIDGTNSTLRNCIFENNHAYTVGALHIAWTAADCDMSGLRFINNTAYGHVGAISFNAANSTLNNITFENNHANIFTGALSITEFAVGIEVSGLRFINNTANNGVGAMYINAADSTLNNITFENNHANDFSSALYIASDAVGCYVSGLRFINNTADNYYGAMSIYAANSTLNNITFENNHANDFAGALYIGEDAVGCDVSGLRFINNTARNCSAMIVAGANSTLRNITFENNRAENGASALFIHKRAVGCEATGLTLINNFAKNADTIAWNANGGSMNDVEIIGGDGTTAVNITGNNNIMTNIRINYYNGTGIKIRGKINQLRNTTVSESIGTAIDVEGKNNEIINTEIKNHEGTGVEIDGDNNQLVDTNFNGGNGPMIVVNGKGNNIDKVNNNGHTGGDIVFNNPKNKVNNLNGTGIAAVITASDATYSVIYGGKYIVTISGAFNQKVTFKINGIRYTTTTDSNGVARIILSRTMLGSVGSKKITIAVVSDKYVASPVTKNINVIKENSKIASKNYKFKKSAKSKKVKATLKDSQGIAIKKVKVTLKIKGKMVKGRKSYSLKTSSKGAVSFNLKKTKFAKKGKYSATLSFKGDGNYNQAIKKIKIQIK